MDRRRFLVGLAGACCAGRLLRAQTIQTFEGGCAVRNDAAFVQGQTRSRSGNAQLDNALIAEVKKVDNVFGINPGYRYFEETGTPNAYATPETRVQGTAGTILFGLKLLGNELVTEYGGAAVAGIAAHEGAHILQYNKGLRARLGGSTAKRMELHADVLAGYYFSRTGRTERSLVVFAESLFAKGDYEYNNPNHHGTPQQRVTAMRTGYGFGSIDLAAAIERGIQYVANA